MKRSMVFALAFAIGAAAAVALANNGPATVTRHDIRTNTGQSHVHVVTRPVVEPAATVSRELAEQPVHPYLIEVQMGTTRIMLDPEKNYHNKPGPGYLDQNHSILKAQSRAIGLKTDRVIIYRGTPKNADAHDEKPRMIMFRLDQLEKQLEQKRVTEPELEKADEVDTPTPESNDKKMAQAD